MADAVQLIGGHARRNGRADGLDGARRNTTGLADLRDGLGTLDLRGGDALGAIVEHVFGALDVLGHGASRRDVARLQRAEGRATSECGCFHVSSFYERVALVVLVVVGAGEGALAHGFHVVGCGLA